ncbi:MAG: phosphomannomutase/phosphoglucomutase [Phycisphaerales bacterium]
MLGRIFKAYDIRGTYPDLLNDTMAWQIGFGASKFLLGDAEAAGETTPMMKNIVVGRDMRKSSPTLAEQLIKGINDQGGNVIDIGMVDTSMVYFAINHLDCAGGVMVTASHNPPQYNGFKISKRKAKPVGEPTGLADIRKYAAMIDKVTYNKLAPTITRGRAEQRDLWDAYIQHVRSFLDLHGKKLKIVVDASNAMAGTMVPRVFGKKGAHIPGLEIVEINYDNSKGVFAHEPNPLVPENVRQTQDAVLKHKADLGFCFDGDADRCMLVDEKGQIVGCDHLTALMARHFLKKSPGAAVAFDLRSSKAVSEEITKAGGVPVRGRVGHVFMKQALSDNKAVFGGELSGHFYFRDNFNADSGAIAMAVALSIRAEAGKPMSSLISPIARYAQSGEINFETEEKDEALAAVKDQLTARGTIDELDGVTIDRFKTDGWWCNVRKSNTEPLLRLNAEAKDKKTLAACLDKISPLLGRRVAH